MEKVFDFPAVGAEGVAAAAVAEDEFAGVLVVADGVLRRIAEEVGDVADGGFVGIGEFFEGIEEGFGAFPCWHFGTLHWGWRFGFAGSW